MTHPLRRIAAVFVRISAAVLLIGVTTAAAQETETRTVELATLNWEPYYGEDLKNGGFITELARKSFARVGYDMKVNFIPWARAMARAQRGIVDGLLGAYYNKKRAKDFYFSDNLYNDNVGLITLPRTNIKSYDNLQDLKGYSIGMGRGFSVNPAFDRADFLNKVPARNNRANVHKLFAGRLDMVVDSWIVLSNIVQEAGYDTDKIVFVEPPLNTRGVYVAISRQIDGGEEIAQAFNAGLTSLHNDGVYTQVLKKHGMPLQGTPERG